MDKVHKPSNSEFEYKFNMLILGLIYGHKEYFYVSRNSTSFCEIE
jgi:hypothetical protein